MPDPVSGSNVPPFQIGRLSLQLRERTVQFEFPDTGNVQTELARIFQGQEYPSLNLPNYSPALIVDIGANVGASAIYFHGLYPDARIICFEPSPTSFALLQRNVSFNPRMEIHQAALSDFAGTAPLYVGRAQLMQNSLIPNDNVRPAYETVEIRKADSEFERLKLDPVSILKLDTEGSELAILQSLGDRSARIDVIYLEYHSESDRLAIDGMLSNHFVLAQGARRRGASRIERLSEQTAGDELRYYGDLASPATSITAMNHVQTHRTCRGHL